VEIQKAIRRADRAIDARPERVHVYFDRTDHYPRGLTNPYSGWVYVFFDSRRSEHLRQDFLIYLPWTMAHELFHAKRGRLDAGENTLLDDLITEGGAESFARSLYPHSRLSALSRSLPSGAERELWAEWRTKLDAYDHGDPGCVQPIDGRYAGRTICAHYTIGSKIVSGYMANHSDATFAEVARMSSRDVYEGSGYPPNGSG
jgi:uncharacterized protein YjaZ